MKYSPGIFSMKKRDTMHRIDLSNFNGVSYSQIGNGAKHDKRLACDQRKVNTNTFEIKYFSNEFQIY